MKQENGLVYIRADKLLKESLELRRRNRKIGCLLRRERAFSSAIAESARSALVILGADLRVRLANEAFLNLCKSHDSKVEGHLFFAIWRGRWDLPQLRSCVLCALEDSGTGAELEVFADFGDGDRRTIFIQVRAVNSRREKLILISMEDLTHRNLVTRTVLNENDRLQSSLVAGFAELNSVNLDLKKEISRRKQVETNLRKSEAALLQSREDLRHLSASLMHAQDAERRRVARELHDDLSQRVARLQFDVETLEQKVPFSDVADAKNRLRDIRQHAETLSVALRRVAHQLHPATLDHLGLSVALRAYAEEFSRSTAIRVKFTSIHVPEVIPIELASGFYRIVQEALRNVGKHSSNATVEIVLARSPGTLALFIRDSGEGFDQESVVAKGGLGLISMQERVRLLDGKFSLETSPGKGVFLGIQCPLP